MKDAATDRDWKRFLATVAGCAVALTACLWAAVLLVDPFDVLPFSPDLPRGPVDANQRYAYPALARDPGFDSLVVGTSVGRLLKPSRLGASLGGRFVNLAMNAASPWEQSRLFDLFRRSREEIDTVLFEIDPMWCQADEARRPERPFPAWLYDASPWNDLLPHLSLHGLEQAGRQVAYLTGWRPARFGADGYARYLPAPETYDAAQIKEQLEAREAHERAQAAGSSPLDGAERKALAFPDHDLMREMLAALPAETRKILLFAPMHRAVLPTPDTRGQSVLAECKTRLMALAAETRNVHLVDFMIDSPMTRTDENFWDAHHFTEALADRVVDLAAEAVIRREGRPGLLRYLGPRETTGK